MSHREKAKSYNTMSYASFHQPIRIEQQLCSNAQFGGTKLPYEFKKRRCYDDAQKIFRQGSNEI